MRAMPISSSARFPSLVAISVRRCPVPEQQQTAAASTDVHEALITACACVLPPWLQVAQLPGSPTHYVLDGAHTADSAAALGATLRAAFPQEPVVLLLAMAADKEHRYEQSIAISTMRIGRHSNATCLGQGWVNLFHITVTSSTSCLSKHVPCTVVPLCCLCQALSVPKLRQHSHCDSQHSRKPCREVLQALRAIQPKVAVFTSVPIAGSHARSAPPGEWVRHCSTGAVHVVDNFVLNPPLCTVLAKGTGHEDAAVQTSTMSKLGSRQHELLHACSAPLMRLREHPQTRSSCVHCGMPSIALQAHWRHTGKRQPCCRPASPSAAES